MIFYSLLRTYQIDTFYLSHLSFISCSLFTRKLDVMKSKYRIRSITNFIYEIFFSDKYNIRCLWNYINEQHTISSISLSFLIKTHSKTFPICRNHDVFEENHILGLEKTFSLPTKAWTKLKYIYTTRTTQFLRNGTFLKYLNHERIPQPLSVVCERSGLSIRRIN